MRELLELRDLGLDLGGGVAYVDHHPLQVADEAVDRAADLVDFVLALEIDTFGQTARYLLVDLLVK